MTGAVGFGSLKCVIGVSRRRALAPVIVAALRIRIAGHDLRELGRDAVLVHTDADAATIRDLIAPAIGDGESVLVVEFERWSSRGGAVDARWLGRRGH